MTLGEGVRFVDNATIPEQIDLTEALSTEDDIDITTDVVTDGPSLLSQINDLPDRQANEWELVQRSDAGASRMGSNAGALEPEKISNVGILSGFGNSFIPEIMIIWFPILN